MIFKKTLFFIFSSLFVLGVVLLGYFIPRTSFISSLCIYAGLFTLFLLLYQSASGTGAEIKKFIVLAILLRLVLLFSLPQWSDDYFRFVWDGHLILEGQNPYILTPEEVKNHSGPGTSEFLDQIFPYLNSPNYHSVYPPSNQLIFGLAAYLAGENLLFAVLVIRLVLIAFELVALYLMYQLLLQLEMPTRKVLLYALNPLVIMEITGNLHFEGLMLTFILGSIIFLLNRRYIFSGAMMGFAVGIKLSPLILVPVLIKWLPWNRLFPYLMGGALTLLLVFVPLIGEKNAWSGFWTSLTLYGDKFEFNASVYYLLRQLGYWVNGYNMIAVFNPLLKGLTVILILWWSFHVRKGNTRALFQSFLYIYWVYFLLNSVIHPWYILPALALSLFTGKNGFLIWSFLIFLSYHAYRTPANQEWGWILGVEYLGVLLALWWDYYRPSINRSWFSKTTNG